MSRTIPVKGLKELDAYLTLLPKNMQKAAVRQALTAAAKPIRDEARSRVSKVTGKLAKSIETGSPRQNQDGTFSISVRTKEKPQKGGHAFLGLFLEYGVDPHPIARHDAKRGRAGLKAMVAEGKTEGRAMKIGDNFRSGVIEHPGFAPQPFLLPALDVRADDAIRAFAGKIRDYLEEKTGFAAPLDEAA